MGIMDAVPAFEAPLTRLERSSYPKGDKIHALKKGRKFVDGIVDNFIHDTIHKLSSFFQGMNLVSLRIRAPLARLERSSYPKGDKIHALKKGRKFVDGIVDEIVYRVTG